MKKIVWIALATLVMVMTFNSCGTQQTTTQPTPTPVASDSVVAVTPMADVVSVVEALDVQSSRKGCSYHEEVWL